MFQSLQRKSTELLNTIRQGAKRTQTAAAATVQITSTTTTTTPVSASRAQPFFDTQYVNQSDLQQIYHPDISTTSTPLSTPSPQLSLSSTPVIKPKFWYGDEVDPININLFQQYSAALPNPSKYIIDCKKYLSPTYNKISSDNEELISEMKLKYDETGLVLLKNTGLTELSEMRKIMDILMPRDKAMEYKGGSNWRNYIDSNVYDTGAPYNAWIHYHHEMAYVQHSPLYIGFACKYGTNIPRKGATFVSDQRRATEDLLNTELGEKLKEYGICYVRNLTDREYFLDNDLSEFEVYNHWQQSFNTNNMEIAEKEANLRGLLVEWDNNHPKWGRYMKTRFYTDAYEYCPYINENILYASVADHHMWFDSWPGVSRLLPEDRPLEITYGNDEKFSYDELKLFVDIYDRYGIPIDWEQGDIGIMCNYRWAHGRPGFTLDNNEKREIGVVLGPVFERIGQKEDKWTK